MGKDMATTPLAAILRETIERDGPIPVEEFVAAALTHPEHGYYTGGAGGGGTDRIGSDFITAPEISQMFGELIGAWCAVVWQSMGKPDPVRLVEFGPGRGTLMADALRTVDATAPDFAAAIDLHLVEASPGLQSRQAEAIAGRPAAWHRKFDGVPKGPAIAIANEFFDALPVMQFERLKHGWHERRVGLAENGDGDGFVFTVAPEKTLAPVEEMDVGDIFEVCPGGVALVRRMARRFSRTAGAALIVDYGHVASATGDTLQAIHKGERADPLENPGEADITAHVDFASLARSASQRGAVAHGPVSQRDFLMRLGIEPRAEALAAAADPGSRAGIAAALHRLIGTGEMGTLFKAMAIQSDGLPPPPGFEPPEAPV